MISHRSTLLFATCITCLGSILGECHNSELNSAIAYSSVQAFSLEVAQVPLEPVQLPLEKGSQGEPIIALQEKLKQLGYYDGLADGSYSEATELAIIKFQKSVGLEADGIVGPTTWSKLQATVAEQPELAEAETPEPDAEKATSKGGKRLLLLLSSILVCGAIGGGLFLFRWLSKQKKFPEPQFPSDKDDYISRENPESVQLEANTNALEQTEEFDQTEALEQTQPSQLQTGILEQTEALEQTQPSQLQTGILEQTEEFDQTETLEPTQPSQLQTGILEQTEEFDQTEALEQTQSSYQEDHNNGYNSSNLSVSPPNSSNSHHNPSNANSQSSNFPTQPKPQTVEDNLPLEKTTRLAKINIVDELIKDLQQGSPQKRRKAIWELAQQGDSRAVKPLVDLMIDSDSQQRSLILEALSQIGNKTLKPLNKALALSLQDDNAQVRKNAIRDLTRIYEVVAQMSQMLYHAADDPDPEVKETAQWAMNQLSRIRIPPTFDNLPPSKDSSNLRD
ncbi:MAG: hypothetical protein F6K14_03085 [Symploca sp. SIO2C1]|nr:hypothetical protein [Symploca sp. SIO2C1]